VINFFNFFETDIQIPMDGLILIVNQLHQFKLLEINNRSTD